VVERVFDAPVAAVWKAWSDPEAMKRWWGPHGFTAPSATIDFRVGGRYVNCMHSIEQNKDYWSTGTYQEIVPMQRIVTTDSFADENGTVVPASYYGMSPEYPLEMHVIITFEDLGGKTKLKIEHSGMPNATEGDGASKGWSESLDKLAESLKN
jgi:uncharacterized protein YndB with AHSA1/START domain